MGIRTRQVADDGQSPMKGRPGQLSTANLELNSPNKIRIQNEGS